MRSEQQWASAEWQADAVAWLDRQWGLVGMRRTGDVEQPHLRPWATVLRAQTADGPVWLKATGPGTAFEVGLYEVLTRVVPGYVLTPIAVDLAQGWVLLPDGGPPLADRAEGDEFVDALSEILPRYGQLQRDLVPEADALLALGVSDMRPAVMPQRFDQALEAASRFTEPDDRASLERVAGHRGEFASWCERLATMPVPPSLDHNDLHPWNMLVRRLDRADQVRFYDWGDAVVAHPFASMLVPLGMAQRQLDLSIDAPEIHRLRDAYLEAFSDIAPHSELVEALELACRVGKVARALTWDRALKGLRPEDVQDSFARAPLECLRSLLDDSYLGGA